MLTLRQFEQSHCPLSLLCHVMLCHVLYTAVKMWQIHNHSHIFLYNQYFCYCKYMFLIIFYLRKLLLAFIIVLVPLLQLNIWSRSNWKFNVRQLFRFQAPYIFICPVSVFSSCYAVSVNHQGRETLPHIKVSHLTLQEPSAFSVTDDVCEQKHIKASLSEPVLCIR